MTSPEDCAVPDTLVDRNKPGRERMLATTIRAAAIAEFSRHGFKGASTKAIAERAGLTKPHLHYYISSKEDLYEDLLYSVLNGWSSAFAFDIESDDPKQVLSHYVRKKLYYALDNPGLSRIFTSEVLGGGRNLGRYWPVAVKSTQQKVDVFEVPIVVQSWAILERIRTMIEPHGASLALAISRLIKSASVSGRRSIWRPTKSS